MLFESSAETLSQDSHVRWKLDLPVNVIAPGSHFNLRIIEKHRVRRDKEQRVTFSLDSILHGLPGLQEANVFNNSLLSLLVTVLVHKVRLFVLIHL
jgi:hypothetical protein